VDKEAIKALAKKPELISGIYNYCDRWCERCTFTSRCMTFAVDQEHRAGRESRDAENEAFWDGLDGVFNLTLELLQEMAEREGVDLDSLDVEESLDQEERVERAAKEHVCAEGAISYVRMVKGWFDSTELLFEQKGDELETKARLALPNTDPEREARNLQEIVKVIRWYHSLIYAKVMRGLQGEMEERSRSLTEFPKDSDGSVKVALIAMDRSLAAWAEMRDHFPEQEDAILGFLVHLERLRRGTEKAFPHARAFVRPGFDDPAVTGGGEQSPGECLLRVNGKSEKS